MAMTIAYYVTGHGFGHARRSALVIGALLAARPGVRVVVRTTAPAGLFAAAGAPVEVAAPAEGFDPGVVERDALTVDPAASLARLAAVLGRRAALVEAEAAFIRACGAALVVADVPFLAGDAARAAGVPCVGVGNFTWDWIYAHHAGRDAAARAMVAEVAASYGRMDELLQLPLGHEVTSFPRVTAVPLVASRARLGRAEVDERFGLTGTGGRPRVLVALRGGVSDETVRAAAAAAPDAEFVVTRAVAGAPANLRHVSPPADVDFTDVMAACDAVVSKLGYGTLADCAANGVAMLYPPRANFAEDEVTARACPRYVRMRGIGAADFHAGRWGEPLRALLAQPAPPERVRTDGAAVVAGALLARVGST